MTTTVTIHLNFSNPARQSPDPAQLNAAAAHVASHFRQQGHTITPTPTGARGGAWLDLVMQAAEHVGPTVIALSDAASFVKTMLEIRKLLREEQTTGEVRASKDQTTITVRIDDPRADEELLAELLEHLPATFDANGAQIAAEIDPRGKLDL